MLIENNLLEMQIFGTTWDLCWWLALCVNLARPWSQDLWSNTSPDVDVKLFLKDVINIQNSKLWLKSSSCVSVSSSQWNTLRKRLRSSEKEVLPLDYLQTQAAISIPWVSNFTACSADFRCDSSHGLVNRFLKISLMEDERYIRS